MTTKLDWRSGRRKKNTKKITKISHFLNPNSVRQAGGNCLNEASLAEREFTVEPIWHSELEKIQKGFHRYSVYGGHRQFSRPILLNLHTNFV